METSVNRGILGMRMSLVRFMSACRPETGLAVIARSGYGNGGVRGRTRCCRHPEPPRPAGDQG